MKFEIDFNRYFKGDTEILEKLGGVLEFVYVNTEAEVAFYTKEINTLDELLELQKEVNKLSGRDDYQLLIDMYSFSRPIIYFEKDA